MFYVLDADTILIVADMSGLKLSLNGALDIKLYSESKSDIDLSIDLDPKSSTNEEALSAKALILEKIAGENISALKLVYLNSSSSVKLADNSIESTGTVVGVSKSSSVMGGLVKVLVFGILEDAFFNYGINERLFLGSNGEITTIQPISGVLTSIGFGLGSGAIQIGIDKPILL